MKKVFGGVGEQAHIEYILFISLSCRYLGHYKTATTVTFWILRSMRTCFL